MIKRLEMPVFVITGFSILFCFYIINVYGDIIDIFFYIFFIVCSLILSAVFYKRNKSLILIIQIINILCVSSLNKIDGFPDKEFKSIISLAAFLILDIILVLLFVKNKNRYAVILMFFMLNFKIFQLPIDITRQLMFANKINAEEFKNNRISPEFITKTDKNRLFVLGKYASNEIVVVFRKDGNNDLYVFEDKYWLPGGDGSMDAQIPNYQFWEKAVLMKIFNNSL